MGRASKLFPLAGRKASIASQSSTADSRDYQPQLSKAERLLGTTGLQDTNRNQLPRRPSYMNLNPSISELGEEADYDDFSTPDHFGLDPLPLRLADLNDSQDGHSRRLSSSASFSRSFVSNQSRRVKGSWSSNTLKSHYDATNVPPSISQQTSNSAVRDRALRRGMPPVFESSVHDHRRPSTASVDSSTYDNRDSMDRATALPDITRLYPKSGHAHHSHLSPVRAIDALSSANASSASPRFPGAAPTSRPNTSTGTGSLRKAAGTAGKTLKVRLSVDAFPNSMKLFSRRQQQPPVMSEPKPKPTIREKNGSKNWWDKFPLEEPTSDVESEHDPNLVTPTEHLFPPLIRNTPSPRPPEVQPNSGIRRDTVYSIRKTNSSHDVISARSSTTLRSPRRLSRSSRPNSRMTVNDLHETSILSTSSSDDEDGSEPEIEDGDDLPPGRVIRDSIIVSEIDVHHIGQAQAMHVKTMRRIPDNVVSERRPSNASVSSNPTTADSSSVKSSSNSPSYLSVPNRNNRSRKSGHTRQPSSIPEDNDISSQVASPISPPASMRSFSAPHSDGRKLMAVTEEEEALLELMRRKRADKAAQRDSGLTSIKSSSTRSHRPFSNMSGTSSILDSFPLSRSQRSSLLASRATTQPTGYEQTSTSKDSERGRKRQSVATTATDNTYYSIDSRLESPTRLKYAFTPHLSLASLDVSLSGLPSPSLYEAALPSPEPLPSPTTPLMRQASADVLIREASSKRNSSASYAYGDRTQVNEEVLKEKLQEKLRRKTTSNVTPNTSPDPNEFRETIKSNKAAPSNAASSDEEASPKIGSEDGASTGSSKRASTLSKNTSECGSACGHFSCAAYKHNSIGNGSSIGTRCSVSEDVLAAWGSLGGWRDPGIMG